MNNWKIIGLIATAVIVISIPIYMISFYLKDSSKSYSDEAKYIGRERCKDCHQKEYKAFIGSHHDKAMDVAADSTVLGNFNNSEFEFNGVTSKFYKNGEKFFVRTNGPNGKMGDFEITHTFGFTPLQQYLIPFENGRYQCLPIAWDSENKQWFSLVEATYGENIPEPNDWLYWTNNGHNWNGMCAECHSTNLQKNFDPEAKEYNTTYSEIDVSCEACHGPGSKHEEWANLPEMARSTDTNYDLLVKTSNITNKEYVDLCVYCHSRRSSLGPLEFDSGHSMDMVIPRVLDENFHPDGQILEENYVFASFTHSKMFENDVKCNDCHDVHSGKRLFEGNELCAQCHLPEVYDNISHHFHKKSGEDGKPIKLDDRIYEVGEGALCVNCHMPGKYYMGNDFRNDHSLRIPRPDLTIELGTPNACNQCHKYKSAKWADNYITKWYGEKRKPHFGQIFAKARSTDEDVLDKLIELGKNGLYLPIVRATAVSLLANYSNQNSFDAIIWALKDDDPIIRFNAVHAFNSSYPKDLLRHILPLLNDPVKAIRIQAGFKLSILSKDQIPKKNRKIIHTVIEEYIDAIEYSADFSASRHNLGILNSNLKNHEMAAKQYKEAIEIDSFFYPSKVNLSVVLNQLGRNDEAETVLRDLLDKHPEVLESYYSLGLLLAEQKKYAEAITFLEKATKLIPGRSRIFYNLGLIYQFQNSELKAEKALKNAIKIDPKNLDYHYALADHYIKTNQNSKAEKIAKEIKLNFPLSGVGEKLLNYLLNNENNAN